MFEVPDLVDVVDPAVGACVTFAILPKHIGVSQSAFQRVGFSQNGHGAGPRSVHEAIVKRRFPLAHVPAKHALGLDPRVESGSPTRTCAKSESTAFSIHMGSLGDPIWMENAVARSTIGLQRQGKCRDARWQRSPASMRGGDAFSRDRLRRALGHGGQRRGAVPAARRGSYIDGIVGLAFWREGLDRELGCGQ